MPAGKINDNESSLEALIREVQEETSVTLKTKNIQILQTLWVENTEHAIECHNHLCELSICPQIILSEDEHQDYKWVNKEEALELNLIHDLPEFNMLFSNKLP